MFSIKTLTPHKPQLTRKLSQYIHITNKTENFKRIQREDEPSQIDKTKYINK